MFILCFHVIDIYLQYTDSTYIVDICIDVLYVYKNIKIHVNCVYKKM